MPSVGFHTDAFNSSYWCFDQCLEWARVNKLDHIECGALIERSLAWVREQLC